MERVRYDRELHLDQMMSIASRQIAQNGPTSGLHPGDVAHRIGNGLRNYDTDEVVPVWVSGGAVVAFGLIWRQWDACDLGVDPTLDDSDCHTIAGELAAMTERDGRVETESYSGDPRMAQIVTDLGFVKDSEPYVITSQDLSGHRTNAVSGYTIRGAEIDDADGVTAAHVSALASSWTTEQYRSYMQTPPYDPSREVIAVSDSGEVAGFAVVWIDSTNHVGYFEPVGTHAGHQRHGVGSAVIAAGMDLMFDQGMTRATVMHEADALTAAAFYKSCGFTPIGRVVRWVREPRGPRESQNSPIADEEPKTA